MISGYYTQLLRNSVDNRAITSHWLVQVYRMFWPMMDVKIKCQGSPSKVAIQETEGLSDKAAGTFMASLSHKATLTQQLSICIEVACVEAKSFLVDAPQIFDNHHLVVDIS